MHRGGDGYDSKCYRDYKVDWEPAGTAASHWSLGERDCVMQKKKKKKKQKEW